MTRNLRSPNQTLPARGVLAIVTGTAGGQILVAAASPLLSRLYDPADFGTLTVISSMSAIVGTVAALRFELAVPLPRKEEDALSLVMLGLGSVMATALIASLALLLSGDLFVQWLQMPSLGQWLFVVPLTAAAIGVTALLNQLAVRQHRFSAVGRRSFLQSAAMTSVQASGGLYAPGAGGLIVGLGFGQALGAASLLRGSDMSIKALRNATSISRLRNTLRTYSRFPILLAPAGLLNVAGLQLPPILFAYFYGAEYAGWLSFSQRILALPVALVATAIAQVYLAQFAVAARTNRSFCRRLHTRATVRLAIFGFTLAVATFIFAPTLFVLIFGKSWAISGEYSRVLALGLATQFVAAPLSQSLIVLGRETIQFSWDSMRCLATVASMLIPAHLGFSHIAAVWTLSVTSAAFYLVLWFLSYSAIGKASDPESLLENSGEKFAHDPVDREGQCFEKGIDPVGRA